MKRRKLKSVSLLLTLALILTGVMPAYADIDPDIAVGEVAEITEAEEIPADTAGVIAETEEIDMNTSSDAVRAEEVAIVKEVTEVTGDGASAPAETLTAMLLGGSSMGDLWDGWDDYAGDAYAPAGYTDGTKGDSEDNPLVIGNLANLMWLSVNITKGTAGVNEMYYRQSGPINLEGLPAACGDWNPIGWYKNAASASPVAFTGHYDGGGNTITGLNIVSTGGKNLEYLGLFGLIGGDGSVKNLNIQADVVSGYDYLGILAGKIEGDAEVHDVTVSGSVTAGATSTAAADAHIGAITGEIAGNATGDDTGVVIENATVQGAHLYNSGSTSYTGGIAGAVSGAYIVDTTIRTDTNNGFQGCGYCGGIAGILQGDAHVYNSKVDGIIGTDGTVAEGIIAGKVTSGNEIYVAELNASLKNTNMTAELKGLVIGTRDSSTSFVFGTDADDNCGYIYYNASNKALKKLSGAVVDQSLSVTQEAHTGYWRENEKKYTVMEGENEYPCAADRYYYEELEDGVRFITTTKLNRQFTAEGYAEGLRFHIDHYAPGNDGVPVYGHLVSVKRIDSDNSTDTDVAVFEAIAGNGSVYYKKIDKDSAAAVPAGITVKVTSSAKNTADKRFQRVVDETVDPEGLVRPTYTDETGAEVDMTYQTGGDYTFTMPDSDTEINILYELALSKVVTSPTSTTINIRQKRTGDRKNPSITWTIKDENGHTIAPGTIAKIYHEGDPITAELMANDETSPVNVQAIFDSMSADNKVMWTVDDDTLLNLKDTVVGTYTDTDARIAPEVTEQNSWLLDILSTLETAQKNANYTTKLPSTVYEKTAVLTATTDPTKSVGGVSAYATCNVKFTFAIDDQTQLLTEGVSLDKESLTFDITRRVTGSRRAPQSTYTITTQQDLKATIIPADADVRSVTWDMTGDAATSLTQTASGEYDHDNTVKLIFDGSDLSKLPEWVKTIVAADDAKKAAGATDAQKNAKLAGSGSKTATLTVTATDKELSVWKDTCDITVNFQTVDETPDVTDVSFDKNPITLTVTRKLTGYRNNPTETWSVSSPQTVTASLVPSSCAFLEDVSWNADSALTDTIVSTAVGTHKAQNTVSLKFSTTDASARPSWITAIINADDAEWAKAKNSYIRKGTGTKSGKVTLATHDVTTVNGAYNKAFTVTVTFETVDETRPYQTSGGGGGGGGGGGTISGGGTTTKQYTAGSISGLPSYVLGGNWTLGGNGKWRFASTAGHVFTSEWGAIYNPYAVEPQARFDWFVFDAESNMITGWYTDTDGQRYYLWPVSDNTLGHMVVGYQFIDGYWYYFHNVSDGSRGHLVINGVTPEGYPTNAAGQILVNGVPADQGAFTVTQNTTASLTAAGIVAR